MQDIARQQGATAMAAEFTQSERSATAQISRHVESATNGQIGTAPGLLRRAYPQSRTGRHRNGNPHPDRQPVDVGEYCGARQAYDDIGVEGQRRTRHGDLERSRIAWVA